MEEHGAFDEWFGDGSGGAPVDPFAGAAEEPHNGTASLRAARELLQAGDALEALSALDDACRKGVPSELAPHAYALRGTALQRLGRNDEAVTLLARGWGDFPDFAALPALLGTCHLAAGRPAEAARALFAALLCEDPEASLVAYRRHLSAAVTLLTRAA